MMRLFPLLALLLLPCALPGQSTPSAPARPDTQAVRGGEDPVAAVNGYYEAAGTGDWNRAVSFVHPRTLTAFRAVVDKTARTDSLHLFLPMLLGVNSLAEYKALSDQQVMARFFVRNLDTAEGRAALSAMKLEVTNVTIENADRARITTRDGPEAPPEEVWVLRLDGRWFVLLDLEP